MVQASKHSSSGDRFVAGQGPGQGALEREAPMGPGRGCSHGVQVPLVDDDHVIKALSADRPNEPLGDRIHPPGPKGCSDAGGAQLG